MKLVVAQWRRVKYEGAVCAGRRLLTLSVVLLDVAAGAAAVGSHQLIQPHHQHVSTR